MQKFSKIKSRFGSFLRLYSKGTFCLEINSNNKMYKDMVTIVYMLLISTAVAAIVLIQATFSARFVHGGKLERPEIKLFRECGALYLPFELSARRFRWKRLLYFIRAVGLPASEAVVYRLLSGIRAAVRNVYDSLRKMPMQPPLAQRICRFAISRYYFGLRLRLQVVPTENSGGYDTIGKRIEDWPMRCQSWRNSGKMLLPAIMDYKRILFLTCLEVSPTEIGSLEFTCTGRKNLIKYLL